jgi:NTP pyrophosphatase (non-canonical NTP hydrolase)
MHKDEAMDIAHRVSDMTLDALITAYAAFHAEVENTPDHFQCTIASVNNRFVQQPGKPIDWQRGLHAAIGLSTEAAEILDAHKKELYGKQRKLSPANMREECGDIYFYLHLLMDAYGFTLRDIIADNVTKLANRYIEKFDV